MMTTQDVQLSLHHVAHIVCIHTSEVPAQCEPGFAVYAAEFTTPHTPTLQGGKGGSGSGNDGEDGGDGDTEDGNDNNTASSGRRANKRSPASGNNSASNGPRKRGHAGMAAGVQMQGLEAAGSGDAGRMAAMAAAAGFAAAGIDPMEALQLQQAGMLMPGQFWAGMAGMEGASEEVRVSCKQLVWLLLLDCGCCRVSTVSWVHQHHMRTWQGLPQITGATVVVGVRVFQWQLVAVSHTLSCVLCSSA